MLEYSIQPEIQHFKYKSCVEWKWFNCTTFIQTWFI